MELLNKIDFIVSKDIEYKKNCLCSDGILLGVRYEFGQNKFLFSYNDFLVELITANRGSVETKSIDVVEPDVLIGYTQNISIDKITKD